MNYIIFTVKRGNIKVEPLSWIEKILISRQGTIKTLSYKITGYF